MVEVRYPRRWTLDTDGPPAALVNNLSRSVWQRIGVLAPGVSGFQRRLPNVVRLSVGQHLGPSGRCSPGTDL